MPHSSTNPLPKRSTRSKPHPRAATRLAAPAQSPSASLRGIQALEVLAPKPLTAAEVGRSLQVNRSTALRLLLDLEAGGYVSREPTTKRFSAISARLWGLMSHTMDHGDWRSALDPILSSVRDDFGEATCFGVPANGFMVYMSFFPSVHPFGLLYDRLGVTRPMHCSAIGKAYLSALNPTMLDQEMKRLTFEEGTQFAAKGPLELRERLEDVRREGYAIDWQESLEGGACVAVPVWVGGTLIGAAGVLGPLSRMTKERIGSIGKRMVEDFARVSGAASHRISAAGPRSSVTLPI